MADRNCGSSPSAVTSLSVPNSRSTNTLMSLSLNEYEPNARSRTAPRSVSRTVTGWLVPHFRPGCSFNEKNTTSDLNGDLKPLSQCIRSVRIGRLAVFSVWRPGPK